MEWYGPLYSIDLSDGDVPRHFFHSATNHWAIGKQLHALGPQFLPKFDSKSPWKVTGPQIGKAIVFQPSIFFRGELLNFRVGFLHKLQMLFGFLFAVKNPL